MRTAGIYDITDSQAGEREATSVFVLLGTEPRDAGQYFCQAELAPHFPAVEDSAILTVQGICSCMLALLHELV